MVLIMSSKRPEMFRPKQLATTPTPQAMSMHPRFAISSRAHDAEGQKAVNGDGQDDELSPDMIDH